jgi:hypothetical protein
MMHCRSILQLVTEPEAILKIWRKCAFFGKFVKVYPDKLENFPDEKSELTFHLWKQLGLETIILWSNIKDIIPNNRYVYLPCFYVSASNLSVIFANYNQMLLLLSFSKPLFNFLCCHIVIMYYTDNLNWIKALYKARGI